MRSRTTWLDESEKSRIADEVIGWAEDGVSENDAANETVDRLLADHAARAPFLTDAQPDELAAICRAGPEDVRHARRA